MNVKTTKHITFFGIRDRIESVDVTQGSNAWLYSFNPNKSITIFTTSPIGTTVKSIEWDEFQKVLDEINICIDNDIFDVKINFRKG